MTTDITKIPTLQDIYDSKAAMDDIQSFTYNEVDSFIDNNGVVRDTVTGRIKKMGYAVPLPYAGGISFAANDNVKTVEQNGIVYAPLPSSLPFVTSGTFTGDDDSRFFVVQTSAQLSNLIYAVDLAFYISDPANASIGFNNAAAAARASGQALVSYDSSVVYVLNAGVPVDATGIPHIDIKAKIDTTALDGIDDYSMLVGHLALQSGGWWRFNDFISSNALSTYVATDYPQLRVNGSKDIVMEFGKVRFFQFYQTDEVTDPSLSRASNAYNEIYLSDVMPRIEIDSDPKIANLLWCNENNFYGGRVVKVVFKDKGYTHNHNKFINPLFEEIETEIRIERGSNNEFTGCRFEGNVNNLNITAITKANPAVVTADTNNYVNGDEVYHYNIGGMTELASGWYTVGNVTPNTYELIGVDSTAYTTYTGGGIAKKAVVYFGENTWLNTVERTWVSSLNPSQEIQSPFVGTALRDKGIGNDYFYSGKNRRKQIEMFNFSGDQTVLTTGDIASVDSAGSPNTMLFATPVDTETGSSNRGFHPSPINSFFPRSFTPIVETPMLPVTVGDVFSFYVKALSGGVRFSARCYDKDGVPLVFPAASQVANLPITDADLWFSSSQMTTYTADGVFSLGSDLDGTEFNASADFNPSALCSIISSEIKFVRFKCSTGNNSNTLLAHASGYYHEQVKGNTPLRSKLEKEYGEIYLTAKPIMGIAPVGTTVVTSGGDYKCTFSLFTTLNGAVVNGAVSATVDIIAGELPYTDAVKDGDIYGILLDDGTMDWGVVSGLAANTFTIDSLTSPAGTVGAAAADGALVYFARWEKDGLVTINAQTGTSYTTALSDADDVTITMDNALANTCTIPPNSSVPYDIGTLLSGSQIGLGATTLVAGAGVTLNTEVGLVLNDQYAFWSALQTDIDVWLVTGSLKA